MLQRKRLRRWGRRRKRGTRGWKRIFLQERKSIIRQPCREGEREGTREPEFFFLTILVCHQSGRQRQKEAAGRSVTSRKQLITQLLCNENDFRPRQLHFDAPSQLGLQRHGVAKFTATKSWFKTQRHRRDAPSKTKDIQHQWPLLGIQQHYRPITLLPCASKVFESFVRDQLQMHCLENAAIPDEQFGFLPERSTVWQLLSTIDDWEETLDNGDRVHACFLDMAKAFDKVNHDLLLHKLRSVSTHWS